MTTAAASPALWYLSRATGVVSLVLLSVVVVVGVLVNRRGRLPGLPTFAVTGLHRNISLLAVALLAVHILSAIVDPYVTIGWVAAIVPFTSPYKPGWVGLGAFALDLLVAVVVTSLVRLRLGQRAWRAVHWLAYVAWPVAVAHGIGAAPDLRHGILLDVTLLSVAAVLAAVWWRVRMSLTEIPRGQRARAVLAGMQRKRWAS